MKGKLARLGAHPVANFVIAKALERANTLQLEDAYDELKDSWEKIISMSDFFELLRISQTQYSQTHRDLVSCEQL